MYPPHPRRDFLLQAATTVSTLAAATALKPHVASASENERRVKVGLIGTSHPHAAGKIAALRQLAEDFEVMGVVEPDEARRAELQGNPAYAGLAWLTEEQLLQTRDLGVVAVETEVRDLLPTASRCIAAGKHIHLEKPGATSHSHFQQLLQDADERKLYVQLGYMLRHNPAIQFLLKVLGEGWLGQIFEIYATMSKTVGDDERRRLAEFAGGGMFELGCHLIDLMVAVLGKPEDVTVFTRRSRSPSDTLADNQLAVFQYPKCTAAIRIALMEVDGVNRRQFVVCGTEGTVDIRPLEPPQLQLALDRPRDRYRQGYQSVELPSMPGRYDDQLKALARVVRGEQPPLFSSSHDLIVHEALLQASGMG